MSEGKSTHAGSFQVSACILPTHTALDEVRYVVQLCSNGLEKCVLPAVGRGEWIAAYNPNYNKVLWRNYRKVLNSDLHYFFFFKTQLLKKVLSISRTYRLQSNLGDFVIMLNLWNSIISTTLWNLGEIFLHITIWHECYNHSTFYVFGGQYIKPWCNNLVSNWRRYGILEWKMAVTVDSFGS